MVTARQVKHPARHPPAQRHAQQSGHDHRAHAGTGFLGVKVFTHDDRVSGHDAALKQAEHGRDQVQRHHAVKGQKHQQRQALQHRAQQQGADAADAVADDAKHQSAHNAAGQHEREHLGPARRAKTQVGAIGHDVHLRHGHGHTTRHARDKQQALRVSWLEAKGAAAVDHGRMNIGRRQRHQRRALAHEGGQQKHAHPAKDTEQDVGLPPADGFDAVLNNRWPDRARNVIATGANRHGNAPAAVPPQSGVGQQRRKSGRAAHKAHQRVRQAKSPDAARQARPDKAAAHRQCAHPQHRRQAVPVGHAAGDQAAQPQADHHQRVGQRRIGPAHTKLGLHRRQHHRDDVHAAVAQHHQAQRDQQAPSGLARIDESGVSRQGCHRGNLADDWGLSCLVGYWANGACPWRGTSPHTFTAWFWPLPRPPARRVDRVRSWAGCGR